MIKMSDDGKNTVNTLIDVVVIALVSTTTAIGISMLSTSLPQLKLDFSPYDIGMNTLDLTVGGYACNFLHDKEILPLIQ